MYGLSLFDNTELSLYVETRDNKAERAKWSHADMSDPASCTVPAITAYCR